MINDVDLTTWGLANIDSANWLFYDTKYLHETIRACRKWTYASKAHMSMQGKQGKYVNLWNVFKILWRY